MTVSLAGPEVTKQITEHFPEAISEISDQAIVVKNESLLEVAEYLKSSPELSCDYLNYIAATDYYDYFEIVYQLTSRKHNHSLILKTRCQDHSKPAVSSVVSLWRGADLQEREIYDLMGITFIGHPNLKRIFLWEGFEGYPLRKDYL